MYSISPHSGSGTMFDNLFLIILVVVSFLLFGSALYLQRIKETIQVKPLVTVEKIRTQFVIDQNRDIPVQKEKKPEIAKKKESVKKEVIDLSEKPVLAQKADAVQEQAPDKPVSSSPVRRVFGLRKVYSQGIGAGGSLSDAVIGKLGNTIHTDVDTFVATENDLHGVVVSTTTVTKAPRFKKIVKPEYSKEMIDNKLEGIVKLKVLIDIDGKVKRATVISDIGYNSAQKALEATQEMEFIPAMRGDEPVAVWIVIPIRFVIVS